ncbi:MAG: TIGR03088 family PEP-CTERM/XrtA system glycosyltransferase [Inhella sp.]
MTGARPLILHVLYRFATGGLENGVVNLINRLPQYRHAVLALSDYDPAFCQRVSAPGVEFISLHKPPGQTLKLAPRYVRELRRLQPDLVHTRNLAALEMQLPTWWAGVRARVHGEHGWDVDDLGGRSQRHRLMRLAFRPFVQRYIALSGDLAQYLQDRIKVPAERITRICNGVDTARFAPAARRETPEGSPFSDPNLFVVGTVGRMQAVKAQTLLVNAFIAALQAAPQLRDRLRLVLAGDGPLRADCAARLQAAGLADLAWLPGERRDVPQIMRGLDAFVLPSLAEGISNTILEAMASGLPVLATRVGGNAELVAEGHSGLLVDAGCVDSLRDGLLRLAGDPAGAAAMGEAGRQRAEAKFSMAGMVNAYAAVYDGLLSRNAG